MTRRGFVTLAVTIVGGAAVGAGCGSSNGTPDGGGGTGGGSAGTGGSGGSGGTGGSGGAGGSAGGGGSADAGTDTHADAASLCSDPLPAGQLDDQTGHTHTLEVPLSVLDQTPPATLLSGMFPLGTSGGHFHVVMFTPNDLAMLRTGGMVTITSDMEGDPLHAHMFRISCRAGG